MSPGIEVGRSFKVTDVVTVLNRAVKRQGKPTTIRVDNGPEFVSKEVDLWADANGATARRCSSTPRIRRTPSRWWGKLQCSCTQSSSLALKYPETGD